MKILVNPGTSLYRVLRICKVIRFRLSIKKRNAYCYVANTKNLTLLLELTARVAGVYWRSDIQETKHLESYLLVRAKGYSTGYVYIFYCKIDKAICRLTIAKKL